jgi:CO/xanthine dehydrogenase Mo-binding subunit
MVAPSKDYKVIGTRPLRPDGTDKVTGRAQYGADVRVTGALFGRVLRSPYAHANIKKIDASKALALPGVKAVITAADFPSPDEGLAEIGEGAVQALRFVLDNFIASKKALYRGHAVAAVCAIDAHIAEDALDLIEVEYEELEAIVDVRYAMSEKASVLHDNLRTKDTTPLAEKMPKGATNIAAHLQFEKGDINKGFAEADVIVEREYSTNMYHQGYIEPHAATALWNRDGHLTVWTSTQNPFGCRQTLSNVLKKPVSDITIMPSEIGGGFGGKLPMYLEPLASVLSKKAGRPVKMTMTREEVFIATGPTSGVYSRAKFGARRDGTITAAEVYMAYEAGAFPGAPVFGGMAGALAPYNIPNFVIDGYDVVLNKPKTAAYRAPGTPAGMFGTESLLNELADKLGIDAMDLRIKNASKEGDDRPSGGKWGKTGNLEEMEAMRNHPHYKSELQGPNRGRGVALGFWGNAGMETSTSGAINADGTVSYVLGSIDIGGTRASLSMQLAETLGIAADRIKPKVVDTDSIGFTNMTAGSRTTFAGGWASYELGMEMRRKMIERAAKIWEVPVEEVHYEDDGEIWGPAEDSQAGQPRRMTFKELAAKLPSTGGTIEVGVNVSRTSVGPAFAGHIADVEVDPETGKVTILRYTAFQDVGTAIHPSYVEGQIQGGAAQGIGMALTEEYYFGDDGRMHNASFLDYRMPTTLDVPMIDTVLIENPNPGHPYGVRGVGEVCIVPPLAAVQSAVADAIGVRFETLPMSPRVVLDALLKDDE